MLVLLCSARKNDMPCSGQPKRMMGNHIFAHFLGIFASHFFATFRWYREAILAPHLFATFLWYREAQICITFLYHISLVWRGTDLHHISLVYREAKKCDANISKKNLLLNVCHPQGG
jgi:hypothetical protein